jgi:hypothetical protein
MNTLTRSQTNTFTIADAQYLASRIASDLTQIRLYYGYLTEQKVKDLAVEAAILLKFGLLKSVKYGFRKGDDWVYYVSYYVDDLGQLQASNDSPGDIDPTVDNTGASWYSHLEMRENPDLNTEQVAAIKQDLPIQRTSGIEPNSNNGILNNDKSYYRNGIGLTRGQYRSN